LTAANRELAFDTLVRVTRLDTGASVIVRINDRGPFGNRRRILDLSRAAAERIDMIHAGVVEVRAEVLAAPE
jgi:rare lipoprotein A